ncbi:MAG: hypothetical protein AAF724_00855 [Pseudomonadota bacterium]
MTLLAAALLFLVFVANVVIGAIAGSPVFGDVTEMLILFAASLCFVAAILRREADAKSENHQ